MRNTTPPHALAATLVPPRSRPSRNNKRYELSGPGETARLSCAISREHRTQTRWALPGLRREKGFMLEQWLNDALEGEEGAGLREPLRTLKQLEMDKGSLRNANLSSEQISSLYSGLFVYSSGIKSSFDEMFRAASLQQRDDRRLEKTYWRIFIKLLENTVPVKTCFQIIEDDFRREVAALKRALQEQHQAAGQRAGEHEEQLRRLRKDAEEEERKLREFQKDYDVMNSNLVLYEETFNEEVALRLKFEEKINQVYTSYDELKEKFEAVRGELAGKGELVAELQADVYRLNAEVTDKRILADDMLLRLQFAERRLAERQEELAVKNQEICDIRLENHSEEERKKHEETALDELMMTIKLLRKAQAELERRLEESRLSAAAAEAVTAKLKEALSSAREKNDELYIKLRDSALAASKSEEARLQNGFQLEETKGRLLSAENRAAMLQAEREEVSAKLSRAELELLAKSKEVQDKNRALEIFDANLAEMKASKDRYERMNSLLRFQLQKLKAQLDARTKQVGEQRAKAYEMKLDLEKAQKTVMEHDITIDNVKKALDSSEVEKKEAAIAFKERLSKLQLKLQEREFDMNEKKRELSKVADEVVKRDGERLNKLDEISYLHKQNFFLEKQLRDKKEKVQEILQQQERYRSEIALLKKKVEGKEYALDQKREEVDGEVVNLKLALAKAKKAIEERKDFVHPMLYQDKKSQIVELMLKIQGINTKNKKVNETFDSLAEQLEQSRRNLAAALEERDKLKKTLEMLGKDISKNNQQARRAKSEAEGKRSQMNEAITALKEQLRARGEQLARAEKGSAAKLQQLASLNQSLAAEITSLKSAKREKAEKAVQASQMIKMTSAFVQTEPVQDQSMSLSKKQSNSLRVSERPAEKQKEERTLQRSQDRQYDKIVDQREIDKSLIVPARAQVVSAISEEREGEAERKEERVGRKVEGREFKAALRLSYLRK